MITVGELAKILKGVCIGETNRKLLKISSFENADANSLVLIYNQKYADSVQKLQCGAILVNKEFTLPPNLDIPIIQVENIQHAMNIVQAQFNGHKPECQGVSKLADIHSSVSLPDDINIGSFTVIQANVKIGNNSTIFPQVYIGQGVKIGQGCIIYPGVKIYPGTEIGNDVIIHSNAVLGCDGFGYQTDKTGKHHKTNHLGKLIIGNHVEIGSCCTLDRSTFDATTIESGVKLDNLIQIGHNTVIKENSIIAAQTGIAGSTIIGKNVVIGGQTGIAGHLEIADGTRIQAKSGVAGDVKGKNKKLYGYPAIAYFDYLRSYSIFKKLPGMMKEFQSIKKELIKLKESDKKKDI